VPFLKRVGKGFLVTYWILVMFSYSVKNLNRTKYTFIALMSLRLPWVCYGAFSNYTHYRSLPRDTVKRWLLSCCTF